MALLQTSHLPPSEASYPKMSSGRIPSVEGGIQPTIFDAKADILTATAADTPARLAVGANDTVLTADSSTATGLKWAAVSSGGMTLISETVASAASSISFSSISGSYKQLVLVWNGIRHSGSGSAFSVRLNNNSGSNYYNRGYAYNSVGQTWADNTLTHIGANNSYVIPSFGRGTSYAGLQGDCNGYMIIDNYASSTKLKGITTVFAYYDASAAGTSQSYASITTTYNSTSAITSVDIVRLTGSDTISNTTDTTIRLYGVA